MEERVEILYEDDDVLVLNKPSGLVVHGDGRTKEETLADWVLKEYPALKEVGEAFAGSAGVEIPRPGIVHRLDKETSGVMLLLKNQSAFLHVKKQFQEHTIVKVYHAFLHGSPKDKHGTILLPIGKSRADFRRRSAEHGAAASMVYPPIPVARITQGCVVQSLDRNEVMLPQSPQAFRRAVLEHAIRNGRRQGHERQTTWQLVEMNGAPIAVVEGEETNIKITTALDWDVARLVVWPLLTHEQGH